MVGDGSTDLVRVEDASGEVAILDANKITPAAAGKFMDAKIGIGHEIAKRLLTIVEERKLSKQFGNKKHIYKEAWTTLAELTGHDVVPGDHKMVTMDTLDGPVRGVQVTTDMRNKAGDTVSRATGWCFENEGAFGGRRPELYVLAGKAETRSISRCIRNKLDWIVVLAGFAATPGEEMTEEMTSGQAPAADPVEIDSLLADLERARLDGTFPKWIKEPLGWGKKKLKSGRIVADVPLEDALSGKDDAGEFRGYMKWAIDAHKKKLEDAHKDYGDFHEWEPKMVKLQIVKILWDKVNGKDTSGELPF